MCTLPAPPPCSAAKPSNPVPAGTRLQVIGFGDLGNGKDATVLQRTELVLERLEACVAALLQAAQAGLPLTRTLAGTVLTLRRDGELALRPEGPRRRGIHPAAT